MTWEGMSLPQHSSITNFFVVLGVWNRYGSSFSLPGVSTGTILVDWLHCVELGISQDAVGNVLWQAINKAGFLPGASREARLTHLKSMLRAFNAELKPGNPIQHLTETMIKRAGKSPKLKSKGAESRGLRLGIKLAERLVQHNPSEAHIRMLCCIDALWLVLLLIGSLST